MSAHVLEQKPPQEPGLYWFTLVKGGALRFCRVWRQDKRIEYGGLLVANTADGRPKPVERFGRYWAGPLPEPKRNPPGRGR